MSDLDPDPILALMADHRTVRRFTEDPVPDAAVERVVGAAQMAATSSHVQGYCLLEVTDADKRDRLVELTGGQPQVAQGRFFVVCGEQRRHRLALERLGKSYVSNLETFLVNVIDATLFAQNAALGFEALGFGTCYIGGLRTKLDDVDRWLELPDDVFPLFGLCVGVPAERPERKPRLPLASVWVRDRFPSATGLRSELDQFDETMAAYYTERGLEGRNWTSGLGRKLDRAQREHLAAYYRSKGAVLRALDSGTR